MHHPVWLDRPCSFCSSQAEGVSRRFFEFRNPSCRIPRSIGACTRVSYEAELQLLELLGCEWGRGCSSRSIDEPFNLVDSRYRQTDTAVEKPSDRSTLMHAHMIHIKSSILLDRCRHVPRRLGSYYQTSNKLDQLRSRGICTKLPGTRYMYEQWILTS